MSYLGSENLKTLIQKEKIITPVPSNFDRIKNGAYELSLGNEVFRTDSKDKKKEILKDKKELVTINPGQFALLLTEESVTVPSDKIAFISIKAGVKLRGLVNVSGFHVDPGFSGKLVFSVYNAGASPISLERGEPYFPIWFAELIVPATQKDIYNGEHKDQDSIPAKYIDALLAGELVSPNVLSKRIDEVRYLKTKIEWVVITILAAVITLCVKLWSDSSKLKDAIELGYQKKSEEISNDSINNKLRNDLNILRVEIDSLKKRK